MSCLPIGRKVRSTRHPSMTRSRPPASRRAPSRPAAAADRGDAVSDGLRLNRALAMGGVCSRRAADELVRQGRVQVNGAVVHDLGRRIVAGRDEILVDGRRVELTTEGAATVVLALNKPRGIISTMSDPSGAPCVADLIPARLGRLFPVGRLDRDSQGLLFLTNDGDLAHRLLHPSFEVPKIYHVTVDRPLVNADLRRLVEGTITMPDGETPLPWEIDPIERSRFGHPRYRCVLREGKKREIREVMAHLGYEVKRLKRVAIGPIELGDPKIGEFRLLSDKELAVLRRAVGMHGSRLGGSDAAAERRPRKPRHAARPAADAPPARRTKRG